MRVKKMSFVLAFFMASVMVSPILAAEGTPSAVAAPEFSWWGYIQAIAVMLIVLLVLWGVVWALRRSGRFAGMPRGTLPRGSMYVEGQLSIAPRKGVVVVRFLNRRLVLGVTEQQISLLAEVELEDEHPSFDTCLNEAKQSTAE